MKKVILFKRTSLVAVSLILVLATLVAAFPTQAIAADTTECTNFYKVRPGDTKATIAHKTGMKWAELAALNNLKPNDKIIAGDKLCYNKATKPAALLTAAVLGNKVQAMSKNAADNQVYIVRARDAAGGDWFNLGKFKAYKNMASQTSFPLPKDLKGIFPLAVCFKNAETSKLTCVQAMK